jgi:putative ABC transport system permease protein
VLGIPILAGRTFSQSEEGGSVRVAIVSAATARRFWPAGQTLGQTIRVATSRTDEARVESDVTVIGVGGDVISGLVVDGIDQTVIYLPTSLRGEQEQALLIRTRRAASAALSAIDAAVASETGATARRLAPMRDVLQFQSWPLLLFLSAMFALAAFGILLALTGCYGMLSYTVARRTREFGIRAAVGATPAAPGWFVARQSAFIASVAIPAGMVLAISPIQQVCVTRRERNRNIVERLANHPDIEYRGGIPSQRRKEREPWLVLPLIDVMYAPQRVLPTGGEKKYVKRMYTLRDGQFADEVPKR